MLPDKAVTRAYLMLGGNIGNSEAIFESAENYLKEHGFLCDKRSCIMKSAAVDCVPGTPDFCDRAISGLWDKSAPELLELLQQTERFFGRPADHRSDMSRSLDCDIIFFGSQCCELPNLKIPHPRAHLRNFVLEPMSEIAPDMVHPVLKKSVKELLNELNKG